MLSLVIQHHPHRTLPDLRRKLVRRLAHDGLEAALPRIQSEFTHFTQAMDTCERDLTRAPAQHQEGLAALDNGDLDRGKALAEVLRQRIGGATLCPSSAH